MTEIQNNALQCKLPEQVGPSLREGQDCNSQLSSVRDNDKKRTEVVICCHICEIEIPSIVNVPLHEPCFRDVNVTILIVIRPSRLHSLEIKIIVPFAISALHILIYRLFGFPGYYNC
jgi:hypothetical protein